MKKIVVKCFVALFFIMIVSSSGISVTSNTADMSQTENSATKMRYPIVRLEWNIYETEMEYIQGGIMTGLFKFQGIAFSFEDIFDISIDFRAKYEIVNGTIKINPIIRSQVTLNPGDTIKWNLLVYNENMLDGEWFTPIALGSVIEKAS